MPKFFIKGVYIGDFKGVLFDKDGTLSYSESHLQEIAVLRIRESKKALRKDFPEEDICKFDDLIKAAYGITKSGIDPHGAVAIASRKDNLISTATIFSLIGVPWSKAINLATEIFSRTDRIHADIESNIKQRPLFPGVIDFLNSLKSHNIKCAVISNDTKKGIESFLSFNNLESRFTKSWSCEDYPSKPDPNAVKELCKKIKIEPSECLLIGDSDSDMQMANLAGIGLSIGYVSGWNIKPQLSHQNKIIFNWTDISCL